MKNDDFGTSSQFQAAEASKLNLIGSPPVFYRLCSAREITTIKIPADRPDVEKVHDPQPPSHAQCQEHGQLRALPLGTSSR